MHLESFRVLYIFWRSVLCLMWVGEDILQISRLLFCVLLTVSFALQNFLSFRRSHLFIVTLSVCTTGVVSRNWSPMPML